MEICGGQTHAIVRHGIDQLLPREIELVHGPGCSVCVTLLELIDKALEIASQPNVIFCSYGGMLRVPGSRRDLFSVKAQGGDVREVYSPLDAVALAEKNPDKQVVFAGEDAQAVRSAMRLTCYGKEAVVIGEVTAEPQGRVLLKTTLGSTRIVDMLAGEMLPRIC